MRGKLEGEPLSKIALLERQPVREEVLPMVTLLTETKGLLSPPTAALIEASLLRLRDRTTDLDTFRYHVEFLTPHLLQSMLEPRYDEGVSVITPLGVEVSGLRLDTQVVVFYINRAGLTMGLTAVRLLPPGTPVGEIDSHRNEKTLEAVSTGYNFPPSIDGLAVLLLDPMNATAGSLIDALKIIKQEYIVSRDQTPTKILVGNIITAPLGVQELKRAFSEVEIHTVALDKRLTRGGESGFPPGYIVPGLGDAGDRQFGGGRSEIFCAYHRALRDCVNFNAPGRIISS